MLYGYCVFKGESGRAQGGRTAVRCGATSCPVLAPRQSFRPATITVEQIGNRKWPRQWSTAASKEAGDFLWVEEEEQDDDDEVEKEEEEQGGEEEEREQEEEKGNRSGRRTEGGALRLLHTAAQQPVCVRERACLPIKL